MADDRNPLDDVTATESDSAVDGTRPAIYIRPGELREAVDQAEKALIDSTEEVFFRDRQLVRVARLDKRTGPIARDLGAPVVVPVEPAHLVETLTAVAEFYKYDARRQTDRLIDCPTKFAEILLARPESRMPPLVGIVEAPTLRPDGSLLDRPGYDSGSGLYLTETPAGYAPPPQAPTWQQAADAAQTLSDALSTFPWETPADESAAMAAIIAALVRRTLPAAPFIGITAPTPGTGKTLLADAIAMIAIGRRAPAMALGDDAAELEKRIGALLMAGDPLVLLDNIERPVKSDLLCQIATQPAAQIRVLGVSKRALLTTRCAVLMTGNNLTIRGDLTRRTSLIRLDARTERPDQIRFERDLLTDIAAERAELIQAALTIPLAYLAAGAPEVELSPAGSFSDWDRFCRRPLVWLGLPDPLDAAARIRDDDPDRETLSAVMAAWRAQFGSEPATAADAVAAAETNTDLREALQLVMSRADRGLSTRTFGYWVRSHQARPCDGSRFMAAGKSNGRALWCLESA